MLLANEDDAPNLNLLLTRLEGLFIGAEHKVWQDPPSFFISFYGACCCPGRQPRWPSLYTGRDALGRSQPAQADRACLLFQLSYPPVCAPSACGSWPSAKRAVEIEAIPEPKIGERDAEDTEYEAEDA